MTWLSQNEKTLSCSSQKVFPGDIFLSLIREEILGELRIDKNRVIKISSKLSDALDSQKNYQIFLLLFHVLQF